MASAKSGAPSVFKDGSNVCVDADVGDAAATEAAFKRAAHVVSLDTQVQRVTGVPMEPRAAVGVYDARTGRYTLHAGSGNVVRQKGELAGILGVAENAVRVIARDVGGNFGTRNAFYPEFALVCWAARRLGRPVKWTCERSEILPERLPGPRPRGAGGAGARCRRPFPRRCAAPTPAMSAPTP